MTKAPFPKTLLLWPLLLFFTLSAGASTETELPILLDCSQHYNPLYYQGSDGSAIIRISDGTPPYVVSWTGPVTNAGLLDTNGVYRIQDLPAGMYEIQVEDADGATANCSFTLDEVECDISLDLLTAATTCPGTATGTFAFTYSTRYNSVNIEWSGRDQAPLNIYGINTFGTTLLPAGTYGVTITDSRNCRIADSTVIAEALPLALDCASFRNPGSASAQDGSISPTLSGGSLPYTLRWTGPVSDTAQIDNPTGFMINSLPAGTYDLELTDKYGCIAFCSTTLGNPIPCADFSVELVPNSPKCPGENSGKLQIEVTGGTPTFIYDWADDQYDGQGADGELKDLPAGIYALSVSDQNGCVAAATAIIQEAAPLLVTCGDPNFPTGQDTMNGEFIVQIDPQAPRPFTIEYSNGLETLTWPTSNPLLFNVFQIDSLAEGLYTVSVTDGNGCVSSCSVDMNIPGCEKKLVNVVSQFSNCHGESAGSINLQLISGTPADYTFDWQNDAYDGQHQLTQLASGFYPVTITAANGCVDIRNILINDPPPLILSCLDTISPGTIGAADGSNTVYALGGSPPYAITWTGPVSGSRTGLPPGEFSIGGLTAGEYFVAIVDNNGCSTDCTFFINDPAPDCELELTCRENGPGEGLGPGSYSFEIKGGTPLYDLQLQGTAKLDFVLDTAGTWTSGLLPAGDWTFIVTDAEGCTQNCTFTVDPPPCDLQVDVFSYGESCANESDGRIEVNIVSGTPPFKFQWSNGATTLDQYGLRPDAYEITVTDANNCENETLVFIGYGLPLPELTADLGTTICWGQCYQYPISFTGSPPFTLEYTVFQNGRTESYREEFQDLQNYLEICPEDLGLTPGSFLINFGQLSDRKCSQEINTVRSFAYQAPVHSILQVNECVTDSIVIENTVFTPANPGGTIVLANAAASGCDSLIEVLPIYFNETEHIEQVLCPGESLTIGNEIFDQNRPTGTVILPNATADFCDSIIVVSLDFTASITSELEETLCAGDSLIVGSEVFNADRPAGSVILQTALGCDSTVTVNLHFLPERQATLRGDTLICAGGESYLRLVVSPGGTYNYQIQSAAGLISGSSDREELIIPQNPMQSDVFVLQSITSADDCPIIIRQDSVNISVSNPQISLHPLADYHGFGVSCAEAHDGQLEVNVEGGIAPFEVLWNDGSPGTVKTGLAAGTYSISLTDQIGCTAETTAVLEAPAPLSGKMEGITEGCNEFAIPLIRIHELSGGSGNYFYQFNGGGYAPLGTAPVELGPLDSSGVYQVFIQDENECTLMQEVIIPQSEQLLLDLGPDRSISLGDSILISPLLNFTPQSWDWFPNTWVRDTAALELRATPQQSTVYRFTALSEGGCTISDEIKVTVNTQVPVFIPNAFSPNGDGVNDRLTVYSNQSVSQIERMAIYDRWGNQLYQRRQFPANDPQYGWDGRYKGRLLGSGTYICQLELQLINGQRLRMSSAVDMIR
ncbi:T9SS type B sorting domain-containing protein [Flavilitoribacter nigricans]|uniref:HYR domain-containing protein n=1 Tax=Flavilitoribacter nigricans (strain ATCC 23147 / DSM 23189 / NBRC 102662 / NCIMB 1420 / SS-2) TaxID=1122177 RepID=A0A2D0NBF2_FLAN2|nr:gliding motility-associated C-terminal domain-containing protein [Flavilitoribacter nigricans]PHN05817.1 hypothetical protein CRP01_15200 [Flavilitoribacter nigricans DSM 23189 = NBRC 102662]